MPLQLLLIERETAKVQVVIQDRDLPLLEELIDPYLQMSRIPCLMDSIWTIYIDPEHIPRDSRLQEVAEDSPDGPGTRVFMDGQNRLIAMNQPAHSWRILYALRMIRNVLRWQLYEQAALFMHGGLVGLGNKGIAFMGGKKSGKTSSILALLNSSTARYCSNDDLTLVIEGTAVRALGWPRSLCIRKDSLYALQAVNPHYVTIIEKLKHPSNRYAELNATGEAASPSLGVYFFPKEIAFAAGGGIESELPLSMIVFPKFTGREGQQARLDRLHPAEALELLMQNQEMYPEKYCGFLREYFRQMDTDVNERLGLLSREIPCYRLLQTFDALDAGSRQIIAEARRLL